MCSFPPAHTTFEEVSFRTSVVQEPTQNEWNRSTDTLRFLKGFYRVKKNKGNYFSSVSTDSRCVAPDYRRRRITTETYSTRGWSRSSTRKRSPRTFHLWVSVRSLQSRSTPTLDGPWHTRFGPPSDTSTIGSYFRPLGLFRALPRSGSFNSDRVSTGVRLVVVSK